MVNEKLKFGNGKKHFTSMNLDAGVVKKVNDLYEGSLSHHINKLLDNWCKDFEEREIYSKILQEALENMRKTRVSDKDLTALEVMENDNKKQELLDEVERLIKIKKKRSTIKKNK